MGNKKSVLHGKPEGREVGCDGVDWIQLTQDSVQWLAFVNIIVS
jgi:hypothetical protein